jgi:hypothetical protein
MSKEYTIYARWLAYELRKQGFRIIRTEPNEQKPQYDVYIFENCEDLQIAISYLTQTR